MTDRCDRCFGYAQGVMGGLLTVRPFLDRFPQVDILDPAQTSFHNAWVTGTFGIIVRIKFITKHGMNRPRCRIMASWMFGLCHPLHFHQRLSRPPTYAPSRHKSLGSGRDHPNFILQLHPIHRGARYSRLWYVYCPNKTQEIQVGITADLYSQAMALPPRRLPRTKPNV